MQWPWFVGIGGTTFAAAAFYAQRYIIYPSDFPEGSRSDVDLPEVYGMKYEDLYLETDDSEKLHAYLLVHEKPSVKTVVMLGPNAGNIGHSLPLAQIFHEQMGYNVLTVSYRGYGRSTGTPSESGLKKDADTVLEYINSHDALRDTSIVLYGRSLGGAVAIYAASTELGRTLTSALVVENTFLSIAKLIPNVMPLASPLAFLLTERWESEQTIAKVNPDMPCLFLSGAADELIPPTQFRALFELCPSTCKEIKSYPAGTHNDTAVQEGYWSDVHAFVQQNVRPFGV